MAGFDKNRFQSYYVSDMKKVNSTMVARQAGVAQSTVSLVVNNRPGVSEYTRRRVLETARRLGYILSPGSGALLLGVIVSGYRAMNSYMAMTITAVKEEIHRRNYRLEMFDSSDVELINDRVVAGAISLSNDPELHSRWKELRNVPLVRFVYKSSHSDNIYSVYSDYQADLRLVFRYLHRMGHRRIGLYLERTPAQEQLMLDHTGEEFRNLLEADGVAGAAKLVSYAGTGTMAERLRGLLAAGSTALVVIPGDAALQVQRELGRFNLRIPEDISLISREYSNVSEYMSPPTTTLLPDYPTMAGHAVDMIEMLLRRERPPRRHCLSRPIADPVFGSQPESRGRKLRTGPGRWRTAGRGCGGRTNYSG